MGQTLNRAMRYPDPGFPVMVDDYNKATYDLSGSYDSADSSRSAALYRQRAELRDNAIVLNVAKNVFTAAQFDTVRFDTIGAANLGVNNTRLTAQGNGIYLCTFGIQINISGTLGTGGNIVLGVSKNGATSVPDPNFHSRRFSLPNTSGFFLYHVWGMLTLSAADFIQGYVFWTGTPAGPMQTTAAGLTMLRINST